MTPDTLTETHASYKLSRKQPTVNITNIISSVINIPKRKEKKGQTNSYLNQFSLKP